VAGRSVDSNESAAPSGLVLAVTSSQGWRLGLQLFGASGAAHGSRLSNNDGEWLVSASTVDFNRAVFSLPEAALLPASMYTFAPHASRSSHR
jgi:hypothetical protein